MNIDTFRFGNILDHNKRDIVKFGLEVDKFPMCRILTEEEDPELPIDIQRVRKGINAHHTDTDEMLQKLAFEACVQAEADLDRSVFLKQIELVHQRPDLTLLYPHIRSVDSVQVKIGRFWKKVDDKYVEQNFYLDGGRCVRILNWQAGQKVKVTYTVGHSVNDTGVNKMPLSISRYIINLCWKMYVNERDQSQRNFNQGLTRSSCMVL